MHLTTVPYIDTSIDIPLPLWKPSTLESAGRQSNAARLLHCLHHPGSQLGSWLEARTAGGVPKYITDGQLVKSQGIDPVRSPILVEAPVTEQFPG